MSVMTVTELDSSALRSTVAFTGRLACMTRAEAFEVVRSHGGTPSQTDRQWIRKCSLLWPGYLRRGGAVPPGADLYGLASHDRGLVGTDVGELDRPRRRGWPRFFRVKTCRRDAR